MSRPAVKRRAAKEAAAKGVTAQGVTAQGVTAQGVTAKGVAAKGVAAKRTGGKKSAEKGISTKKAPAKRTSVAGTSAKATSVTRPASKRRSLKPTVAKAAAKAAVTLPILRFRTQREWSGWLEEHHASSPGLWLQLSKKGSAIPSVTYAEAVEEALCFGWIDGQGRSLDEASWLQKFTPRTPRSIWSKLNRDRVAKLLASDRMRPSGLVAVERAKAGGQWEAAYDSPRSATVPADLQAALDRSKSAAAFFATLNGANRYAILFRIHAAKKSETREKRIGEFIAMLERKEKLYP